MKIKVSEATPLQLNWLVAKAEGHMTNYDGWRYRDTIDWAQGGPIIEREHMEFDYDEAEQVYTAANGVHAARGKTHLIAAMRCYVASKLGDEVDVPEELCK